MGRQKNAITESCTNYHFVEWKLSERVSIFLQERKKVDLSVKDYLFRTSSTVTLRHHLCSQEQFHARCEPSWSGRRDSHVLSTEQ